MNASQIIEHLLKAFYERHLSEDIIRQYGIYPWVLTDSSGIPFADGGDALAAVDRMRARGWIKIPNSPRAMRVAHYHRIQLTEEGIRHAEELLKPNLERLLKEFYITTVEGITRGLKK